MFIDVIELSVSVVVFATFLDEFSIQLQAKAQFLKQVSNRGRADLEALSGGNHD